MSTIASKLVHRYPVLIMYLSVIIFLGIQGLFSFCGKTKCNAFANADFDAWFPYQQPQVQVFKTGVQKDTLTISLVYKSPYEEHSSGFTNYTCVPSAQVDGIFSDSSSMGSNNFNIYCQYQPKEQINPNGSIRIKDLNITYENLSDTGISINAYSEEQVFTNYQANILLNGTIYSNVQTITVLDAFRNSSGITKVYMGKNAGLIGFVDYPNGLLWIK